MHLVVNGELRNLSNASTLTELLNALALTGRLAIEVNGEIVPRSHYSEYRLNDRDAIEIVRAIGGG
ncbi:MAG: sulfur carrier protein ThiS [Gammaproteobacteria bacterium]|nr:sulfur carrier protein ThiS [Gammaproteobacteria bacterium]